MMALLLVSLLSAGVTLEQLNQHLDELRPGMSNQVRFTEHQGNALLATPLVSTGVLHYRPADRALIKQVETPAPATMTLANNRLVIETATRSRRYSLRSRPEMLALLGGFRALIEADGDALQQTFDVTLSHSEGDQWAMSLNPRAKRLKAQLEKVVVSGQGLRVQTIETTLTSGDWQRLELAPLAAPEPAAPPAGD